MTERPIHDNAELHREIHRLCRLLCNCPIDQIPLLELKNVIHANKRLLLECDANFLPCSSLLVMIAHAEIKRRLSDLNDPAKEVGDGRLAEANDQPS